MILTNSRKKSIEKIVRKINTKQKDEEQIRRTASTLDSPTREPIVITSETDEDLESHRGPEAHIQFGNPKQ